MKSQVLIVAAEESSSLYAQRLLEYWRDQDADIQAFGVGNFEMEKLGFERVGRSEDMAVMGLQQIISQWSVIKKAFYQVLEEAEKRKPKVAILMDYPGFNLRLAKRLKKMGIKVVYYISPQVWAWRRGRVNDIRKSVDKMYVLFPFEKKFFTDHDVAAEFVGHPILDEISASYLSSHTQTLNRSRFGIQKDKTVLGLMPGSRRSELKANLETQLETAREVLKHRPDVSVVLLLAPGLMKENLDLPVLDFNLIVVQAEPLEMIGLCDLILCASGTATLMVGLMEKPMVIMYRMTPIEAFLVKRLVKIKLFGLINIIAEKEIVPERFQEAANAHDLSALLLKYLNDTDFTKQTVTALHQIKNLLGSKGATARVAELLKAYL